MDTRPCGFFALVSYVPDPLGPLIDDLRLSLPGVEFRQAHITILPPRPVHLPVEAATEYSQQVLGQFRPFSVELTHVNRFPVTNVLYLELAEGNQTIHDLHDALNTGNLVFKEEFEFLPHLTLGGPISAAQVDAVQEQAEALWRSVHLNRRFEIDEVVALWAAPGDEVLAWQRLWTYRLHTKQVKAAKAGLTSHR
jgi:2'-5' RNA ligase